MNNMDLRMQGATIQIILTVNLLPTAAVELHV
jgi:hypothetical protein